MGKALGAAGRIAIVLGSGAGMYFSIGIVLIYGFSVFVVPIAEDTGWDRSYVGAVVAPIALASPTKASMTPSARPRRNLAVHPISRGES